MMRVLMVCMGNICRSPTAEGVLRELVREQGMGARVAIDSAGTHAYHVGEPPDPRAVASARRRGVLLDGLRARAVAADDFNAFDLILAMDRDNLADLERRCPEGQHHKLALFLDYAPQLAVREVPDPYYGGEHGFETVLDMVSAAGQGLLDDLRSR